MFVFFFGKDIYIFFVYPFFPFLVEAVRGSGGWGRPGGAVMHAAAPGDSRVLQGGLKHHAVT